MMTILPSDLTVLGSAFVFGLFSSIHCSVMCGPLAGLSIQLHSQKHKGNSLYQLGRLLSYLFFGFLLATIGHGANSLDLFRSNLKIAPLLGLLFFVFIGIRLFQTEFSKEKLKESKFLSGVNQALGNLTQKLYKSKNPSLVSLILGLLSGILPCGVLYPAYALAFSMANYWISLAVMFSFFLGTLPLLYGSGFGLQTIQRQINPKFLPLVGVLVLLVALAIGSNRFQMKPGEDCERTETNGSIFPGKAEL